MGGPVEGFVAALAARGRILTLGGVAVIAHGLSRGTKDMDIWLDPHDTPDRWAGILITVLDLFPSARPHDLREHCTVPNHMIAAIVIRDGVIRITGLDRPLDIFREPNNLSCAEFDQVWEHGQSVEAQPGVRIMDPIDLLITKENTSRPHDMADIAFLQAKIRKLMDTSLRTCSAEDGKRLLDRYTDHAVCESALNSPDKALRDYARSLLQTLAEGGDPFAQEALHRIKEF